MTKIFNSETFRFTIVVIIWLFAFFQNTWLAMTIGLLSFIYLGRYFVEFFQRMMRNEWPYNALGFAGLTIFGACVLLSSVISNYIVFTITGVSARSFPSSCLIIQVFISIICAFILLPLLISIASFAASFSRGVAARVVPASIMLAFPAIGLIVNSTVTRNGGLVRFAEDIITTVDFTKNASFVQGSAFRNNIYRDYGEKICFNFGPDISIAPLAQGGYILAFPKKIYENSQGFIITPDERPTHNFYKIIEQRDCPETNKHYEVNSRT